jgi:glyoxylase-like metal-dependent hydrolase (beta-lactamase superfamily II)
MRELILVLAVAFGACATKPEPVAPAPAPVAAAPQASALPSSLANTDARAGLAVVRLNPKLRYVEGRNVSSFTYVVDTSDGAVVIDTSRPPVAALHRRLLEADGVTTARYVVLTHAHGDHTGGAALWRAAGAKVVAQEQFAEFLDYTAMLGPFFSRRSGAQFQFAGSNVVGGGAGGAAPRAAQSPLAPTDTEIRPDITFKDTMTLQVGDTAFELIHTPGETPDHLTVWVPSIKAAFVGDNFYESFPNMYTLRGTRPRWPMDYIRSIERVMALEPELLLPSHGPIMQGRDEIRRRLTQYRDAIVFVHDAELKGMNEGKDVYTLMQEIRLPKALDVGEGYGKISWTVRGIHEGYAGWFTGDAADMFERGRSSVSRDLVELAGGPAKIAERARALLAQGKRIEALQLSTIGLEGAPDDKALLTARKTALEELLKASANRNEQGWLVDGINKAQAGLGE